MNLRPETTKKFGLWMGFILVFGLMACQNTLFSYRGKQAGPMSRVDLEASGKYNGTWHGEELALDYTTVISAGKFQISGQVQLDQYFAVGDMNIKYLYISMHFLDSDGKIIESHLVSATGHSSARRDISFTKRVTLPSDAGGLAFSYTGFAREHGGGGGGSNTGWAFWQTPQR